MRKYIVAIVVLAVFSAMDPPNKQGLSPQWIPTAAAQASDNPCMPPTQVSWPLEQTAWQLFVAATCPVGSGSQYPYTVWETWIEQTQLYEPPTATASVLQPGQRPPFHMSMLAKMMQPSPRPGVPSAVLPLPLSPAQGCNSSTWSKRTICEEVRINPDAQGYIQSNRLNKLNGQVLFINSGNQFTFPRPAIEIKADWIQLDNCDPVSGVHVENVNGTCYALGGLHLFSKLLDQWVWATFEPQNLITNGQRCKVLGCKDLFGSDPTASKGETTRLTTALSDLMTQAKLAPEWQNYRLDGVQFEFVDSQGKPTLLGNSIIEGDNAGTPDSLTVSSCMTCHALSTINQKGAQLSPDFVVGAPVPVDGYVPRDFAWSLSLAH